jgi:hypothetical protein
MTFRLSMLLMPSLWLVLGLCLLSRKKNWLMVVGMLPLTILLIQGAWYPIMTGNVQLFLNDMLCRILPVTGYVVLFLFTFLSCINVGGRLRRELWFIPILFVLPGCIWQHASTMPWAQFGMVASVSFWLKPAGK